MQIPENIIRVWKSRGQIFEGLKNSIFRREDVEDIASQRIQICEQCDTYDSEGTGCLAPKTQPCCDQNKGGCGCSLGLKTRSLSSSCPKGKWDAEVSQEEEDLINTKLGI
jgi:hypothetical protein